MIPIALLAVGIIYYAYNPTESNFFPKCPWLWLTGTQCPSCGIQRFLHLLMHGEWSSALRLNPFLMLSLPYATLAVLGKWYNYRGVFDGLNRFVYHHVTLYTYAVLFVLWWVLRNLMHL